MGIESASNERAFAEYLANLGRHSDGERGELPPFFNELWPSFQRISWHENPAGFLSDIESRVGRQFLEDRYKDFLRAEGSVYAGRGDSYADALGRNVSFYRHEDPGFLKDVVSGGLGLAQTMSPWLMGYGISSAVNALAPSVAGAGSTLGNMATPTTLAEEIAMLGGDGALSGGVGNAAFSGGGALDYANLELGDMSGIADALEGATVNQSAVQGLQQAVQHLPNSKSVVDQAIAKMTQDPKGAFDMLVKYGMPAATVLGLFEKNGSPLSDQIRHGATGALDAAGRYGSMTVPGTSPSEARAIALANQNVGAWKPHLERAGALTDEAAAGMLSLDIDKYMDPYWESALKPQIAAAETRGAKAKIAQNANAAMVGAFGGDRNIIERGVVDSNTEDAIQSIYDRGASQAFNNAVTMANADLNRKAGAGTTHMNLGKTVGALGGADVAGLKDAGALEIRPQSDALRHAADSAAALSGATRAAGSVIDHTKKPSTLTQVTGALGALKSMKDIGLY